ncbi:MAG TPA: hypothetical protein DIT32_07820 [Peptococcaceae bacterium]|nr:hypothetical protein [Peptococcaceae bacterium]
MKHLKAPWYKCDFHLHTMQSTCFSDHEVTAVQWIQAALDAGLECVAVTDHNDYRGIDQIQAASVGKGVTVFPGTEISCGNLKIHVLILFDVDKAGSDIQDFLSKCGIQGADIGSSKGTIKNIFEICEIARTLDCLVIPAHIDDFHGLGSLAQHPLKRILDHKYIDAVQIDNQDIWGATGFKDTDEDSVYLKLRDRYNADIPIQRAKEWQKAYLEARKIDIPLLTFSDNPNDEGDSHHGLWGIGKQYTWLKIHGKPTLASLRQTLASYKTHVKNCFDSPERPLDD